jgi:hypothetical protein
MNKQPRLKLALLTVSKQINIYCSKIVRSQHTSFRGFLLTSVPQNQEIFTMIKLIPQCVQLSQPATENSLRPWLIVRILESNQAYTVARFANRQDADDHLRFLQRFIPNSVFQIMFEPPEKL